MTIYGQPITGPLAPPEQGFLDNFGNLVMESWFGTMIDRAEADAAGDVERMRGGVPGFNPYRDGDLRGYEAHLPFFMDDTSPAHIEATKRYIDRRLERRQLLELGQPDLLTELAAGIMDPANLLAGPAGVLRGSLMRTVGENALRIGAAGGAITGATESLRVANDPGSSWLEAVAAAGAGTLLGGAVGAAGGALGHVLARRAGRLDALMERGDDPLSDELRAGLPGASRTPEAVGGIEVRETTGAMWGVVYDRESGVILVDRERAAQEFENREWRMWDRTGDWSDDPIRSPDDWIEFEVARLSADARGEWADSVSIALDAVRARRAASAYGEQAGDGWAGAPSGAIGDRPFHRQQPGGTVFRTRIFRSVDEAKAEIPMLAGELEKWRESAAFAWPQSPDPVTGKLRGGFVVVDEARLRKEWESGRFDLPQYMGMRPLPKSRFKSFEDFRAWIIEHELAHLRAFRLKGETRAAYEERINQLGFGVRKTGRKGIQVRLGGGPNELPRNWWAARRKADGKWVVGPGGSLRLAMRRGDARLNAKQRTSEEFEVVPVEIDIKGAALRDINAQLVADINRAKKEGGQALYTPTGDLILFDETSIKRVIGQEGIAKRVEAKAKAEAKAGKEPPATPPGTPAATPQPAMPDGSMRFADAFGVEKKIRWSQLPYFLLVNNLFSGQLGETLARTAHDLVAPPGLKLKGNAAGTVATPHSVSTLASVEWWSKARLAREATFAAYEKYRGWSPAGHDVTREWRQAREAVGAAVRKVTGGAPDQPISYTEFRQWVGKALTNGDRAVAGTPPEIADLVAEAAAAQRKHLYGPADLEAQNLGLFGPNQETLEIGRLRGRLREKRIAIKAMKDERDLARAGLEKDRANVASRHLKAMEAEARELEGRIGNLTAIAQNAKAAPQPTGALKNDLSYFHRVYKADAIRARYNEFVDILATWNQQKGHPEPYKAAVAATEMILRDPHRVQAVQNLLAGKPAPTQTRSLDIPSERIFDFIETDAEAVAHIYVRKMAPVIEMARKFGDFQMEGHIGRLKDEWRLEHARTGSAADRAAAEAEWDKVEPALHNLRDAVLGVYGLPDDPSSWTVRSLEVLKSWAMMTQLGRAAQMALVDGGRTVMTYGIRRVAGGLMDTFGGNLSGMRLAAREAELAGEAAEIASMQVLHAALDGGHFNPSFTKAERIIHKGRALTHLLNGLALTTDFLKGFSGALAQDEMLARALKARAGSLDDAGREWLARHGIDEAMAKRIADQWEKAGKPASGKLRIAGTADWTDLDAQRAFRAALVDIIQETVLTPTAAERPLFMSKPLWSAVLLYRTFSFSSTARVMLSGMQQWDRDVLASAVTMVGIGLFVGWLRHNGPGSYDPTDPERLKRAVEMSGILGIFTDLNTSLEIVSDGQVGLGPLLGMDAALKNPTPAQRLGAIAGAPFAPWMQAVWALTSDNAMRWQKQRAIRRLVPYNNMWFWNDLFSRGERALGERILGAGRY